jgi:hypothetical protein
LTQQQHHRVADELAQLPGRQVPNVPCPHPLGMIVLGQLAQHGFNPPSGLHEPRPPASRLCRRSPWWRQILRSLALAGRRFETWGEIIDAIHRSTLYWNAHRHSFVWGKRRRHRPRRSPGIALLPKAA